MVFTEIVSKLRTGELDLLDYLNALCDRIDLKEPAIQAIIPGTYDRNRVMDEARALLEKYPGNSVRPPLFGVPVGVKDIFRVEGYPTRCGSGLPGDLFDGEEAASVTRLKRAGAIMMAKTVTTEFAYNEPGPTRNPHNLEHTPGGSSSGSAAGVSCGFFPLALGSQTVGSVIRPAAFCGIVGYKPSYNRIPIEGVIPYSVSVDHVGFFCNDASGIGTVMSVLCDDWKPNKEKTPPEGAVLGVPEGPYLNRATDNGLAFFGTQIARLEKAGCKLKYIQTFNDFDILERKHRRLIAAEMARYHAPWFEANKPLYRAQTRQQIEAGLLVNEAEIEELKKQRESLRNRMAELTRSERVDFWICPPATDHAPKGIESTGDAVMNLPWTSSGLPVVTIPAGKDSSDLPQGVQLAGSFMEDELLIPMAERLYTVLSTG